MENSVLVMEISVRDVDLLNGKNDGVVVMVTNLDGLNGELERLEGEQKAQMFQEKLVGNVEYVKHVRKHMFVHIPFSSDIYEIFIVRQPKDG